MASLNLKSPPQVYSATATPTGGLCTISVGGTSIFSKVLHPSPSNQLIIDVASIMAAAFNPPFSTTTLSYSVSFNGSSLDTGTFSFSLV